MRTKIKIISALIGIVICIFTTFSPVFAVNTNVEYNDAGKFIFNPSSGDLFADFKDIMPGDSREQKIMLYNSSEKKTDIFLKAEVEDEYKGFLDYITISVYKSDDLQTDGTLIAKNIASIEGELEEYVLLSSLKPNGEIYITVKIDVSKLLSNKYQKCLGKIKWLFSCSEKEESTIKQTTTKENTTSQTEEKTTVSYENTTQSYSKHKNFTLIENTTRARKNYSFSYNKKERTRSDHQTFNYSKLTQEISTDGADNPYTGSSLKATLPALLGISVSTIVIIIVLKEKRKNET